MGCRFIELIRSVKTSQKVAAKDIQIRLAPKISVVAHAFAKEYRGQLLEYRRGGIVALDQIEDESESKLLGDERSRPTEAADVRYDND